MRSNEARGFAEDWRLAESDQIFSTLQMLREHFMRGLAEWGRRTPRQKARRTAEPDRSPRFGMHEAPAAKLGLHRVGGVIKRPRASSSRDRPRLVKFTAPSSSGTPQTIFSDFRVTVVPFPHRPRAHLRGPSR